MVMFRLMIKLKHIMTKLKRRPKPDCDGFYNDYKCLYWCCINCKYLKDEHRKWCEPW